MTPLMATVTQATPLRVRVDGATTDSPARSFGIPPRNGSRVLAIRLGTLLVVLGGGPWGDRLYGYDTRTTNPAPSTFAPDHSVLYAPEFKTGNAIGLSGAYFTVVTVQPWDDDSGGGLHQLAFGTGPYGAGIWRRYGTRGGGWGAWSPLAEDTGWVEFDATQFYDGWSKYSAGLDLTHTPRWRRLNGVVYLEGLVNLATFATTSCHELPIAADPAAHVLRVSNRNGPGFFRLDVNTAGRIICFEGVASNNWHNIACSYIGKS